MNKYTITYDDGMIKQSGEFETPKRLPQQGDEYRFAQPVVTLSNVSYDVGDKLLIIGRTNAAPHYRTSSLGNLLVSCKHMTSVWTNIEIMIACRTLVLDKSE
jgi:hypothetical protein